MNKIDTYQEVTNTIIAALEAGTKPWQKDWMAIGTGQPLRVTGEPYRGINVLLLWLAADANGYRGQHWMTFNQAKEFGASVRKGEKGTRIVFFKSLTLTGENEAGETEERNVPLLRTYTVFNADQIDGLPARFNLAPVQLVGGIERDQQAEAALRSCGAQIREQGTRAFYAPGPDVVTMPDFGLFTSASGYLATLAHELCHWTGHKSRLDRDMTGRFGTKDYAREEMVAELGAAMVGARLGIIGDHIENHAAYLASWIKCLKEDKRAIFRAASAAQAAADLVLAKAEAVAAPAIIAKAA